MRYSSLKATVRLVAFLVMTGGLLPFYLLAFPLGKRARRMFSYPFFRGCVYLTGLSIRTTGRRALDPGALLVANHASYLDIPVLATLADGLFVAKEEVRGWPLFGFLASINRTVFVARRAARVPRERLTIANRLAEGNNIFLFPEGSSSDGTGVLPFRPGLLSAALADDELDVTVQPISIVYGPTTTNRPPLSPETRDCYAWYGDMELAPHLWRLFGLPQRSVVSVHFHPPRSSREFSSRRALALWAERSVTVGVGNALKGRATQTTSPPRPIEEVPAYAMR